MRANVLGSGTYVNHFDLILPGNSFENQFRSRIDEAWACLEKVETALAFTHVGRNKNNLQDNDPEILEVAQEIRQMNQNVDRLEMEFNKLMPGLELGMAAAEAVTVDKQSFGEGSKTGAQLKIRYYLKVRE